MTISLKTQCAIMVFAFAFMCGLTLLWYWRPEDRLEQELYVSVRLARAKALLAELKLQYEKDGNCGGIEDRLKQYGLEHDSLGAYQVSELHGALIVQYSPRKQFLPPIEISQRAVGQASTLIQQEEYVCLVIECSAAGTERVTSS